MKTVPAQKVWALFRGLGIIQRPGSWAQTSYWPARCLTLGFNGFLVLAESPTSLQKHVQAVLCFRGRMTIVRGSSSQLACAAETGAAPLAKFAAAVPTSMATSSPQITCGQWKGREAPEPASEIETGRL